MAKIAFQFLLLVALTTLVGCVRTEVEAKTRNGLSGNEAVAPLQDAHMQLTLVGSREKLAAPGQTLTYKLVNVGKTEVVLADWHLSDQENLTVECQVWFPGATAPDPDAWLPVHEPEIRSARYPLTLKPDNSVIIEVPLDFLQFLVIAPGVERRYFVRAKLNLTSLPLRSEVAAFTVRGSKGN